MVPLFKMFIMTSNVNITNNLKDTVEVINNSKKVFK